LEREGGVWGCFGAKNEIQLNRPKFNPFFNSTFFADMMVLHWFYSEKRNSTQPKFNSNFNSTFFVGLGYLGRVFLFFENNFRF
jgi:hypothetical protein